MAKTKKLAKFTAIPEGEDFQLHIEDDGGDTLELTATREQVDVIVDSLDELLSQDDSLDEVDDDEEEDDEEDNAGEQSGRK